MKTHKLNAETIVLIGMMLIAFVLIGTAVVT